MEESKRLLILEHFFDQLVFLLGRDADEAFNKLKAMFFHPFIWYYGAEVTPEDLDVFMSEYKTEIAHRPHVQVTLEGETIEEIIRTIKEYINTGDGKEFLRNNFDLEGVDQLTKLLG